MIDIETDVFAEVSTKLRETFTGIFVVGEYVMSPSTFPCVSLVEVDNSTLQRTQTTEGRENHATVMYEVNIYSNKTKGKKAECKEIAAFVDELLMGLNFTRIMLEPVPNQNEPTIYRMLGRYRAVVSKDKVVYRR